MSRVAGGGGASGDLCTTGHRLDNLGTGYPPVPLTAQLCSPQSGADILVTDSVIEPIVSWYFIYLVS